jgi:two-component system response regulator AtoC
MPGSVPGAMICKQYWLLRPVEWEMSRWETSPVESSYSNANGSSRFRIFIFDSHIPVLNYLRSILEPHYDVRLFEQASDLLVALGNSSVPHLCLVDWQESKTGIPLLLEIQEIAPKLPVILLTSSRGLESLMASPRLQVRAVVQKPFLGSELEIAIDEQLIRLECQGQEQTAVEIPISEAQSFVHSSKRMREIEAQARLVAAADIPVLILGESGTGKEVLARYTHKMSSRSQHTFLKVNCAAMPNDLIESELFGYEQGAFTGAMKSKQGKFEMCHKGTIFLDEIGEMPAPLQAKLLHVLQDGTFSRLGGRSSISVDVRVVAATNIRMKEAIAQKKFREDLYYRLNGFTLSLPPLRDRREEIPALAEYFIRKGAARYAQKALPLSPRLIAALTQYGWPGNLRELENLINRYLVLGSETAILDELRADGAADAPVLSPSAAAAPGSDGLKRMVRNLKGEAESSVIAAALKGTGWNRKAAAAELRISYKALLYKIKQYNIEPQIPLS